MSVMTHTVYDPIEATSTGYDPIEALRETLEAQFQRHTDHLADLTVRSGPPGRRRDDPGLTEQITVTRQAIADTAHALQRMAEGSYGTCGRCRARISIEWLRTRPDAQFCAPCERTG
ncbi:hypothetical protein GCM10027615_38610 [Plantactinospora veratri]